MTESGELPASVSDERTRFRAIFEGAADAIVVADDDGVYLEANPAACELFGLEREELVGRRVEAFAAPAYEDAEVRDEFLEDGADRGIFPLERDDGEVRLVEYAAARDVRDGEHLSILRDVTDRVEREERIQERLERLDQFASVVSHDLRNPLSIAGGRLELFRETGKAEHYESAKAALQEIDDLATELLALARGESRAAARERVSLVEVANAVWETADTREATLEVVDDLTLRANEQQLRLLLSNLYRNAVGHGGFDVTVRVGALDDGFYVEDTGEGIPAEDRDRVLESGFSTGYGGSGIGLTIVQQIATAHGWDAVVAESEEGGARFEFRATAE